jgi:hypothetical protein
MSEPRWQSLGGKGIVNPEGERRLWAIECMDDLNECSRLRDALEWIANAPGTTYGFKYRSVAAFALNPTATAGEETKWTTA